MREEIKHTVIAVSAVIVVIAAVFIGIYAVSGISPPQTVVESESMQHGPRSHIGVIDTADMIILKTADEGEVRSYVDGYNTNYRTFGSYGDVIVYDRGPTLNPVIHRAILWLEYNGDGTWSAPSLKDYPLDLWECTGGKNYDRLTGILTLKNMGYNSNITANLNLDTLTAMESESGFVTMGDHNPGFDQPSNVMGVKGLIPYEKIKAVAWFEVPWVGAFKMMLNGDTYTIDRWVPNTVPSLVAAIILIVFLLIGLSFLFDHRYYRKYKEELYREMNAPTPLFPVEDEKEE